MWQPSTGDPSEMADGIDGCAGSLYADGIDGCAGHNRQCHRPFRKGRRCSAAIFGSSSCGAECHEWQDAVAVVCVCMHADSRLGVPTHQTDRVLSGRHDVKPPWVHCGFECQSLKRNGQLTTRADQLAAMVLEGTLVYRNGTRSGGSEHGSRTVGRLCRPTVLDLTHQI